MVTFSALNGIISYYTIQTDTGLYVNWVRQHIMVSLTETPASYWQFELEGGTVADYNVKSNWSGWYMCGYQFIDHHWDEVRPLPYCGFDTRWTITLV